MKPNALLIIVASAGLLGGCAATAPRELVSAREAYRRASTGPAAKVAPAEVHIARVALVQAEKAFEDDADSYHTRDLAYVAQRKAQVGTGERNERIRTYNFPQNRVTDHRIEMTLYNLPAVIDGAMDSVIEPLMAHDLEEKLSAIQI